jgi:hypothetical protein
MTLTWAIPDIFRLWKNRLLLDGRLAWDGPFLVESDRIWHNPFIKLIRTTQL